MALTNGAEVGLSDFSKRSFFSESGAAQWQLMMPLLISSGKYGLVFRSSHFSLLQSSQATQTWRETIHSAAACLDIRRSCGGRKALWRDAGSAAGKSNRSMPHALALDARSQSAQACGMHRRRRAARSATRTWERDTQALVERFGAM